MADPLYLNLWFPSFEAQEMLPRTLLVMRQFPFSAQQPGISYLALHPISWDEPTILERRFQPGATPDEAIEIASDLLHEDYAYLFEAHWDLWTSGEGAQPWSEQPRQVKFLVHGLEFDEEVYRENGHIQVDIGLDTPFLGEDAELTPFIEQRVRANVQKLVEFTSKVEKNCGISGRVLWSESEENLAQKLLSRLQKVQ
ncbi:MAG TPA: hypothetical protein VL155_01570 [Terriglobales bacterium]|jgi:hypothetical protein|nr:hypothetical protein [Terriglobales bacterium]